MSYEKIVLMMRVLMLGLTVFLSACGGGGGNVSTGGNASTSIPSGNNVLPITVDAGPNNNYVNGAFVTVTVCSPVNTGQCHDIDHVLVDTGSIGLRILSSELPSGLSLPQLADNNLVPLYECMQFADGNAWGSVNSASIKLGGITANTLPIQIIGANTQLLPSSCQNAGTGKIENDINTLDVRGILGVGAFKADCDANCTGIQYFSCPGTASSGSSCNPVSNVPASALVKNPVSSLSQHNNGMAIHLSGIPSDGARNVTGYMLLGINTASNNNLGQATTLALDPDSGQLLSSSGNNHSYAISFVDSGTNAWEVGATTFPTCPVSQVGVGFYCPASALSLNMTMTGTDYHQASVSVPIANATMLFTSSPSANAFNNLAAPGKDDTFFVWGLPFFYNRTVFTAFEQSTMPGTALTGPLIGF